MNEMKLVAKVYIEASILARTGLRIGGSGGVFSIGGVDNPVIVNPLTREPYIPGSSLRGKMRSLTERSQGKVTGQKISGGQIHKCSTPQDYAKCDICNVFGVPAGEGTFPTRLIVRDVFLTPDSRDALKAANTALEFTEVKTEVSIDRVTSQANPRQTERVPAGAIFGPMQLVFSLYVREDIDRIKTVLRGLALVEDDYLGGHGSRGYGHVQFQNLTITSKSAQQIEAGAAPKNFASVAEALAEFTVLSVPLIKLF